MHDAVRRTPISQVLPALNSSTTANPAALGRSLWGSSRRLVLALWVGGTLATAVTFAAAVPFAVQTVDGDFNGAHSVYATDVDGDGDTDLLGAAANSFNFVWWENTAGDGSAWIEHTIDPAFDVSRSIFAADVDGDGDTDVLGAAAQGDDITWWENTAGDGSAWTPRPIDGAFNGARSVYAADVDGDGDVDVLGAAQHGDEITWWENTAGDGSAWSEHIIDGTFDGAWWVHATDVDGDGDIDVLGAAHGGFGEITWWENTAGDGSTWSDHPIEAFGGAWSVYAADVDGDGDTDVLGTSNLGDDITWWENTTGDGSAWAEHAITESFDGSSGVHATDVDGDGDIDVLGAAQDAGEITWWENTAGNGSTWVEHTIDTDFNGAIDVYATDLDGDGDTDVLGAALVADDITWWENETIHRSAVHPAEHTISVSFFEATSIFATDLDGDGDTDVLGAAKLGNEVSWWENLTGDGSTWSKVTIDGSIQGPESVYAADVDGDGDTDLLGAASGDDAIIWWENTVGDGSVWIEHAIAEAFDGAESVYATDIDGDGDTDVLGAARIADELTWWENTAGDGSAWDEHVIDGVNGIRSVYATDMDGDGDADVLGAASSDDLIAWWENTLGDGSVWTEHTIDGFVDGAKSVYAADIDSDGDTDVLGAALFGDYIAWWENTAGDGSTWSEHTIDGAFDGARSVHAVDVDGDGDIDVLGAGGAADDITWWENTAGDGSAWSEHTIDGEFDGAGSVHATDVDGDGDIDVFGAARFAHEVTWWENQGGQFALPTTDVATARVEDGATEAALEFDPTHRGRAGDSAAELVTLELLLTDAAATPLTDAQADDLFVALSIYLDDGSGVFEPGSDTEVTFVTSFALTPEGVLTVPFADDDPDAQFAEGTPAKYFVVAEFESDASAQTPDDVRFTHITEASSTGEDAANDLPLSLEFSANVASTPIEVNDLPVALPDEFVTIKNTDLGGNVLADNGFGADSDEEGDTLMTTLSDPPTQGTLVGGLGIDGSFTYQPDPDVTGVDTFTYLANDGLGDSNVVIVTINVDPPPIFVDGFESGNTMAWSSTMP